LLRFVDSHSSVDLLRSKFEVDYEVKFNSRYKYAIKVVKALPEQKLPPDLARITSGLGGAGTGNTIRGNTFRGRAAGETLRRKKWQSTGDGSHIPDEVHHQAPASGIAAPGFFDAPKEGVTTPAVNGDTKVPAATPAPTPAPTPATGGAVPTPTPRIGRYGDYGVKEPERERLMLVKGAPEKILEKCTHYIRVSILSFCDLSIFLY
jgi:magnesium-transporting ATPase (P-type)